MAELADRIATETRIQQELVRSLDFAEREPDSDQQFEQQAIAVLRFMLQDGKDGYKGRITDIMPTPAADNQWLYDPQVRSFSGRFADGQKIFKFTIARDGEKWVRAFKPVAGVQDFGEGELSEFGWLVKRVLKCEYEGVAIAIGLEYLPGDVRFPGKRHSKKLKSAYGHLQGFRGGDKEALDCYVSQALLDQEAKEPEMGTVRSPLLLNTIFVVQQVKPDTGEDDEEKLMIGWEDIEEAERAYLTEMPCVFFGGIQSLSSGELKGYRKEAAKPEEDEDENEVVWGRYAELEVV